MDRYILSLNPGSSTLKFSLNRVSDSERKSQTQAVTVEGSGIIDRFGTDQAVLRTQFPGLSETSKRVGSSSVQRAVEQAIQTFMPRSGQPRLDAIGCRVVHGGDLYSAPTFVSPEVLEGIRGLSHLAPLHNPMAADVLESCRQSTPDLPLVAVFDTAFHRTIPDIARTYALPHELSEKHKIQRYGFHGIAHRCAAESVLEQSESNDASSRMITCHLGSGASICAIKDGQSVDTSMGMTPMEGLPMSTRSGDLDPGILLYLLRDGGMPLNDLDDTLNHKSGLLGLSGLSGDMRDIENAAKKGDERCKLALEVFAYRTAKAIGSYFVALGGLDVLVFSGGIGEHSSEMRQRICVHLECLGVALDAKRNEQSSIESAAKISARGSAVDVRVVAVDEGRQIARETAAVLNG